MRLTPNQTRMAITAGASTLLAAGATAAWIGADQEHRGRERVAAAGYLPGTLGLAATLLTGPVALGIGVAKLSAAKLGIDAHPWLTPVLTHPNFIRTGQISKMIAGVGIAALAGLALGTVVARTLGPDVKRAQLQDADLPAPNMERAHLEASETLKRIDRSKDNIVIWVPGTMRQRVPAPFREGLAARLGSDMSLVNMPARPDYQIPQGVSDTSVALEIILDELERTRKPGQRILLAGESQGSWALAKVMHDPTYEALVDRAVVWGNPGVSPYQFDGIGTDKILELSEDLDVVGRTIEGDAPMMLDGLTNTFDGHVTQAWRVPASMINNPSETYLIARTGLRLLSPGGYERDPHNYREFMNAAARFLSDAPAPAAAA